MTDLETLIRREFHFLADGVNEDKDLAARIIKAARRRRIRKFALLALFGVSVSTLSIYGYISFTKVNPPETSQVAIENSSISETDSQAESTPSNSLAASAQKQKVLSAYPVTWEDSIGDLGAISKPAGIGDTIGGLTAKSLKVAWSECLVGKCPTTWTLTVVNNTEDLISASPSLMIYVDHSPLISSSRPLALVPGKSANLVFTFPELDNLTNVNNKASWQWNWFLTAAR